MGLLPSFNLGFSSKKSSGTQTGTIKDALDSLVTGNESVLGTKSSDGSTSTSGSQSSVGSATGQSTSATTGGSQTSESQIASGSQFGADVLDSLKGLFNSASSTLGAGQAANGAALASSLNGLNFNAADYAKGITDSARVDIGDTLDSSLNGLSGSTGGSADGNSLVALLGSKLRSAADAKLAGINSDALAAGSAIANANTKAVTDASAANSSPLLQLAQIIKGGETTQAGQTAGTQDTTQQTAGTTAQQTAEQTNTLQTQISKMLDLISQLTNTSQQTNTDSTRTLDLKTTGKESGFSASAGLGGK